MLEDIITNGIAETKNLMAQGNDWKTTAFDLEKKVFKTLEQDSDFVDPCPDSGRDDSEYIKALAELAWDKALKADDQKTREFLMTCSQKWKAEAQYAYSTPKNVADDFLNFFSEE